MKADLKNMLAAVREMRNDIAARLDLLLPPADDEVIYRCNVCGRTAKACRSALTREQASCRCGSSVRLRSLIHLLTEALFGKSLAIDDIPLRPDIVGIDMSGAPAYADRLVRRLGYTNTFLHKPPYLDITAPADEWLSRCDFLITSDVFEHVAAPVSVAFNNALRLLKPGGLLVLTVPWVPDGETIEHFPPLIEYRIERHSTGVVLVGYGSDGEELEYDQLVFHGGEGETLEMRVFSKSGLMRELASAGFEDIRIHADACDEFGIVWMHPWSLPITARRPPE